MEAAPPPVLFFLASALNCVAHRDLPLNFSVSLQGTTKWPVLSSCCYIFRWPKPVRSRRLRVLHLPGGGRACGVVILLQFLPQKGREEEVRMLILDCV